MAALAAIGSKWKLIIVYWLAQSPKHFAALRREMPGMVVVQIPEIGRAIRI
jgi:DNA-binding HxlR family transcriptional regulator